MGGVTKWQFIKELGNDLVLPHKRRMKAKSQLQKYIKEKMERCGLKTKCNYHTATRRALIIKPYEAKDILKSL